MRLSTLFYAYRKAAAVEAIWERLYFIYGNSPKQHYARICEKNFKRARKRAKQMQLGLTRRLEKLNT